jgi:hypothetical protein
MRSQSYTISTKYRVNKDEKLTYLLRRDSTLTKMWSISSYIDQYVQARNNTQIRAYMIKRNLYNNNLENSLLISCEITVSVIYLLAKVQLLHKNKSDPSLYLITFTVHRRTPKGLQEISFMSCNGLYQQNRKQRGQQVSGAKMIYDPQNIEEKKVKRKRLLRVNYLTS